MKKYVVTALAFALCLAVAPAQSADVPVTWLDETCGYFVVELPESDEPEKFGLFSARGLPIPNVGDIVRGDMTEIETQLENLTSGDRHTVIHWADAKLQEQLVRNTPVQCASKWKGRMKR